MYNYNYANFCLKKNGVQKLLGKEGSQELVKQVIPGISYSPLAALHY